jgi:hypothetical protein
LLVLANFRLMRSSFSWRSTTARTTAMMASVPPSRSYRERSTVPPRCAVVTSDLGLTRPCPSTEILTILPSPLRTATPPCSTWPRRRPHSRGCTRSRGRGSRPGGRHATSGRQPPQRWARHAHRQGTRPARADSRGPLRARRPRRRRRRRVARPSVTRRLIASPAMPDRPTVRWEVCQTAAQVAAVLRTRGWQASPKPCPETCAIAEGGLPGDAHPEARARAGFGRGVIRAADGTRRQARGRRPAIR